MKYTYLILTAIIVSTLPAHSQGLDELVQRAIESNHSLHSTLARYEALKARAGQNGYLEDPKLTAGYFLQPVETRVGAQRATFAISQMFPWFGTLDAKEQSAARMADAAYQQYLDERNRVVFDITAVYNSLYAVTKSSEALAEHQTWLGAFKDVLTTRYENGRAGLSDVLRIEMELQTLRNKQQDLEEKRTALRQRVNELTGGGEELAIRMPDTLATAPTPDEDDVFAAIAGNPSLERFTRLGESWDESARAARKMGMPSFTIGAMYTLIDERDDVVMADNGRDAILAPQIGISLPIYRGKYSAMEEEALQQKEAVAAERRAAVLRLESQAAEALEALRNARRSIALYRNLSMLSQRTRDIVIEEYTNAKSSIDDVIQIERQNVEYLLKLEQARADYNTSVARIKYLTGKQG